MRICITTTFDRNYSLAGSALLKSVRNHTDCTGVDFKVITADPDVVSQFGPSNCHFTDTSRYAGVAYGSALTPQSYHHSWYRFELFSFSDYDRVICIDSDCLCVGDISYLFSEELNDFDLVSVEDYIVSRTWRSNHADLRATGMNPDNFAKRMSEGKIDIQPALLVANKSILGGGWYGKLLEYANAAPFTYSIDQGTINDFIYQCGLRIKLLPIEWDYQDLYEIEIPDIPVPEKPIIVHFQQSKPFARDRNVQDPRLRKWHEMWWKEYYAP